MSDIPTSDIVYSFLNRLSKSIGAGSFSIMILAAIKKRGKAYGYEIMKDIGEISGKKIELKESTLYPILRSLDEQGFLGSFWEDSQEGPRRRYYIITDKGAEALELGFKIWTNFNSAIKRLEEVI
ncbi:MAG: PadR family transcriptional regulator [Candidatus Thermoplasmatota archaeon]|nr:PadR family transcriptional regulator [Candidatus Thermoplasmatota archaeon]